MVIQIQSVSVIERICWVHNYRTIFASKQKPVSMLGMKKQTFNSCFQWQSLL